MIRAGIANPRVIKLTRVYSTIRVDGSREFLDLADFDALVGRGYVVKDNWLQRIFGDNESILSGIHEEAFHIKSSGNLQKGQIIATNSTDIEKKSLLSPSVRGDSITWLNWDNR